MRTHTRYRKAPPAMGTVVYPPSHYKSTSPDASAASTSSNASDPQHPLHEEWRGFQAHLLNKKQGLWETIVIGKTSIPISDAEHPYHKEWLEFVGEWQKLEEEWEKAQHQPTADVEPPKTHPSDPSHPQHARWLAIKRSEELQAQHKRMEEKAIIEGDPRNEYHPQHKEWMKRQLHEQQQREELMRQEQRETAANYISEEREEEGRVYAGDPYLGYPHEEAIPFSDPRHPHHEEWLQMPIHAEVIPFPPSDPRSPEHEEWLDKKASWYEEAIPPSDPRHPDYEEAKNRRMCPANFNPVCGVDGKVYSNGCNALNAGTRSSSDLIFDHKTRTCIPKDALAEGEDTSVDTPASTPTGSNTWMYVGIAAGILLVGGGSYLYMKKKKAQGLA